MMFDADRLTVHQLTHHGAGEIRNKEWVEQDIRKYILPTQPERSGYSRLMMTENNLSVSQIYLSLVTALRARDQAGWYIAWS